MGNRNYRLFLLGKTCLKFYFRGIIGALYFMSRELSVAHALWLISFYNVLVVVLEYPTGVIGDLYGHKTAVVLGCIFYGIGMLLLSLPLPSGIYILALAIAALGSSLESGSDLGLMKAIVPDFKKVYPGYKSYTFVVYFLAAVFSGYLFKLNPWFPVFLTGFFCFLAAFFFSLIKCSHSSQSLPTAEYHNFWTTAKLGVHTIFSSSVLLVLFISFTVMLGYIGSSKTLINGVAEFFTVDVLWLTYAVGAVLLARSVGAYSTKWLTDKYMRIIPRLIAIGTVGMSVLTYSLTTADWWGILLYFVACGFLITAVNSLITMYVTDVIPAGVISSVLSFFSLGARLFASFYLFVAGYVLGWYDISTLFLLTAVIFGTIAIMNMLFAVSQSLRGERSV